MQHSEHENDEHLIEKLKAGNESVLAILVKRWHRKFCDKAYFMVKDKDVAKDIAQDSWTVIMEKIHILKEPKQFKYWAFRIVCNKSTDWLRAKSKKLNQTTRTFVELKSDEENYTERKNLKIAMAKAIDNLPENQKIVLKLFYIEEYNLKEISEILDISVGTVKSRLFHAREKLKRKLKQKYYEN